VNKGRSIRTEEIKERVYRRDYTKVDDAPVLEFGEQGTEDGCLQFPYSLDVNSRDEIILVDTNNDRIQVFDGAGKFLWKFGSKGSENGQFDAFCVAFDHRNHQIVVADTGNHRIQIFDEKGTFIRAFGSKGKGPPDWWWEIVGTTGARSLTSRATLCAFGEGIMSVPGQVFVDSDDNILVACNGAIHVFISDGTHLKTIGKGVISEASGVSMDLAGRIFVSDISLQRVIAF